MADFTTHHPTQAPPESERDRPEIAQQIEDALREGSRQIQFDTIEKHFRGKRVWVLDREKMQAGVMRVVDQAILKSQQEAEGGLKTRQRVATALVNLFGNKRNLTSPVDPNRIAAPPTPPDTHEPKAGDNALEQQIARLASLINRAERVLALASPPAGQTGSRPRRVARQVTSQNRPKQDEILIAILQDNLELIRGITQQNT